MRQHEVVDSPTSSFQSVFSTIWYELQERDWPLRRHPVEAKIWLLGSSEGIRKVLGETNQGKEILVSPEP